VVIGRATAHKAVWAANKFVVMLNSNEGSLSIDLLNRSLPIRLAPTGDVTQRKSPIGNPKLEYLPVHRKEIEAERWGMIDRWATVGRPLDESVAQYPMGPWAKVIGGILMVNGLKDFLGNYSATRAVADPVREALGQLAFYNNGRMVRISELVKSAVQYGLAKTLLPGVDTVNEASVTRALGHLLRRYADETFTVHSPAGESGLYLRSTFMLLKKQGGNDLKKRASFDRQRRATRRLLFPSYLSSAHFQNRFLHCLLRFRNRLRAFSRFAAVLVRGPLSHIMRLIDAQSVVPRS
jgi:hypothetical protein